MSNIAAFAKESRFYISFVVVLTLVFCAVPQPAYADLFDFAGAITDTLNSWINNIIDLMTESYGIIANASFLNNTLVNDAGSDFQQIYIWIEAVNDAVTTPCAIAFLSLFMLFELWRVAQQQHGMMNGMPGVEQAFFVMFKACLMYVLIVNAFDIMCAAFNASQYLTGQVFNILTGGGEISVQNDAFGAYRDTANPMIIIPLIIAWLFILITGIVVQLICFLRVLTAALICTFAPIGLLFFVNEDTKQMGMGYLRSFIGICLQGIMLAIIVGMMPFLLGDGKFTEAFIFMSNMGESVISIVFLCCANIIMCLVIIILCLKSSQFTHQIVGG